MKDIEKNVKSPLQIEGMEVFSDLNISKIEKLLDTGMYYRIWVDESYFYLFHKVNKQFALKSNSIEKAHKFFKTEDYSEISNSFIAYRYSNSYVHIIYDDGYIEEKTFKFVGEEHNGIRAVKTINDRWFFYDTIKRRINNLTGKNGYILKRGFCLSEIIGNNVFTIKNSYGSLSLVFNIPKREPIFFNGYFEEFYEAPEGTIVGKLYGKEVFCIIKYWKTPDVVGYYNTCPKYMQEHNLFVARKGNSWCVVKGKKEIQNSQWKESYFCFLDGYILNKENESSSWNLYSSETGHLIPNNWKNIRLDITENEEVGIIVDTPDTVNKKIKIIDIAKESNNIIQSISNDFKSVIYKEASINNTENFQEEQHSTKEEPIVSLSVVKNTEEKPATCSTSNNKKDNSSEILEIPKSIDYYLFVKKVVIHEGFITNRINCKELEDNSCIAWIVLDSEKLILTEYHRLSIHKVIYKTNKDINKLSKYANKHRVNHPYKTDVSISKQKNEIINLSKTLTSLQKLFEKYTYTSLTINDDAVHNIDRVELQNKVKTDDTCILEGTETIANNTKIEELNLTNEDILTANNETLNTKHDVAKVELPVRESEITLDLGDVIKDSHKLFTRRRYIKSGNNIYILFHPEEDRICSSQEDCDYLIKGEGKDPRFDQNFGQNSNGMLRASIGDSNCRCFIFKRNKDNNIVLLDRVKCVDCTYETEKDTNRLIIIFKMVSLINDSKSHDSNDKLKDSISETSQSASDNINNIEPNIDVKHNREDDLIALKDNILSLLRNFIGPNKSLKELELNITYATNGVLNYSLRSCNNIIKGELSVVQQEVTSVNPNMFLPDNTDTDTQTQYPLQLSTNVHSDDSPRLLNKEKVQDIKDVTELVIDSCVKEKDVNVKDNSNLHKPITQHGISYYVESFSSLHVFKQRGQTAPHKAILLLSLMDLVANGSINSNKIEFNEGLEEQFMQNWKKYARKDTSFHPVPSTPFWYMQSEPFWKLIPRVEGVDSTYLLKQCNPGTPNSLRANIRYAEIDEELFVLMQKVWNRQKLRKVLLNTYL